MSRTRSLLLGAGAALVVWTLLTLGAAAWDTYVKVQQLWALEIQRAQAAQQVPPTP